MVNLRTRLLVGYGYMMVLLLMTAGSAAFGFFTISEAIDRILEGNFRSVSSALEMMESLEEQNALTMHAILARRAPLAEIQPFEQAFEEALERAKENVTIDGEEELLSSIRSDFTTYVEVRNAVLLEDLDVMPMELFALRISPAYIDVRRGAAELLSMNHEAIIQADRDARDTALQMAGWLGFLVTIALLSMVFLARALQTKILARLTELMDVAESLLTGEHSRRFDATANDELGMVARQLNAALDDRDELQAQMRGRLNQQKQLVLGLLEVLDGEILLLGVSGRVIASTLQRCTERDLAPLQDWIDEHRQSSLQEFRETRKEIQSDLEIGGIPVRVNLLAAEGRRPVGWLVQVLDGPKKTVESKCEEVPEEAREDSPSDQESSK